jgi:prolyl-tRNA synthetase
VLRRVSQIVREEMDGAGAREMLMPALCPTELLAETGRAEAYGDLLFRFNDRHGRDCYLGPTHEEVITELCRASITSYKQLPVNLYQIQTKFRDEFRPRAGLLRGREFLMKDAYSFHDRVEGAGGLNETYDAMYRAYSNVYRRCGLDFTAVEAESGPIGGSASHEFMVNAPSGEDTVLVCPVSGYAANVEKCEIGERAAPAQGWFAGEPSGALEKVHTPGCPGISDVCAFMKVKPRDMLKTVVFKVVPRNEDEAKKYPGDWWVLAVVRGDHEVNEGKVRDLSECQIVLADREEARAKGYAIGFVSPRAGLGKERTLIIVDPDAAIGFDAEKGKAKFWVTGADEHDHHVKHFNWQRDFGGGADGKDPVKALAEKDCYFMVGSIRNAVAGDPSPRAKGARLEERRGIEVGHIFKLGTKYSEAMGLTILDDKQAKHAVIMGCYGIGVSRTVAAAVEQNHDADGIVWPAALAPYHVLITVLNPGERTMSEARGLAAELSAAGADVLIDDRDERAGPKFKDADLIGIPVRLTVSDKTVEAGAAEFKARRAAGKGEVVPRSDVVARCLEALGAGGAVR